MKYLFHKLLVILIIPFSIHASDVYYCVDDEVIGFEPKENFAASEYKPQKFKIMIDLEKGMVEAEELFFISLMDPKCIDDGYGVLICINSIGYSIAISKTDLKYYRSTMFTPGDPSDSVTVAHGSCEKF